LWVTDITEHPTAEGILYCAAVMDAYSRLIVGWSIAEHMRTELVTDALGMAIIRRQPDKQPDNEHTILHSDHGSQYTSWAFGQRLRAAGLLASMGTVGGCYGNAYNKTTDWLEAVYLWCARRESNPRPLDP
jgi:putative transposase